MVGLEENLPFPFWKLIVRWDHILLREYSILRFFISVRKRIRFLLSGTIKFIYRTSVWRTYHIFLEFDFSSIDWKIYLRYVWSHRYYDALNIIVIFFFVLRFHRDGELLVPLLVTRLVPSLPFDAMHQIILIIGNRDTFPYSPHVFILIEMENYLFRCSWHVHSHRY